MKISQKNTIDNPWIAFEPLRLGCIPKTLGTPDLYITVEDDESPIMRIDLYSDPNEDYTLFTDAILWKGSIFIGYGRTIYKIDLNTKSIISHKTQDYFGGFSESKDYLIAFSASQLFKFNNNGDLVWVSDFVGIDGVVIESSDNESIKGEGEWDPPGGWRSFNLDAKTGKMKKT